MESLEINNMEILLTGNIGYIGSVMEEVLLEEGFKVTGFDAGFFKGKTFVLLPKKVQENRGKNQIIKDIRDIERDDIKGFDAIIHLAALSNDPLGNLKPSLTNDINYKATVKLAKLAKETGVKKFIYSSSCSMYGAADVSKYLDEDAKFNPQTAYAKSKVDSERALNALADENFSPVYMRNCTVYGVSPKMRFDLVLNNLAAWAYTTGEVVMYSDGKPWRPKVHVRDLSKAFALMLKLPRSKIHNEAFNVGITEENFTIMQLAEKIVKEIPNSKLKCLNQNSSDTRSYRVNFDKLRDIGFKPEWSVDRGVKELHMTFKEQNLTKEIFEDSFFTTLKRIKKLIKEEKLNNDLRWVKN